MFNGRASLCVVVGLAVCTLLSGQTSPHAAPPSRPESFEWDHQIALFDEALNDGNYVEAESFGRRSLEIVEQLHLDDVKRATSLSSTAESLRFQKKYPEAESLYRQALAIREKVLPPNHPRTAYTLQGLATVLVYQNRLGEGERDYLRAIAIWDRAQPDDYDSCRHGAALDGLGRVYYRTQEYENAEPLYQRALSVWTASQQRCTVILAVVNDLAALYWAQGKFERSEQMYRQIIPLLENELGDEQPELVAAQKAKLARVYMARKKDNEALALLEEVVPVFERGGPPEHELLLQSLAHELSLMRTLHRDSDIPGVQAAIDAIHEIKSQSIEPLTRWQGLMGTLNHTTDPAQRTALLKQALTEAENIGPGPEMVQTLEMLAGDSSGTRQNDRAESYIRRALLTSEQIFGKDSTQVAHDLDSLATILSHEKKEAAAAPLLQREVAIYEKSPGHQMELSTAEQHLADLYHDQKEYAKAEPAYVRSLQAAEASPQPNDVLVTSAVVRLALLYKNWGKYEQAVPFYVRSVNLKEARDAADTSLLADLETLSDLLRKLNRQSEALTYDQRRKHLIDLQISRTAAASPSK